MDQASDRKVHKVAVVYHCWALYRQAIVRTLCQQEHPNPEYTIFSDKKTMPPNIKGIDPALAEKPVSEGGVRWRFLRNIWFKELFLWQRGLVKLSLTSEFDTIIYLGSIYYISTWIAVLLARLRGKRVLMWSHGFRRWDKGLRGFLRRRFYRRAHGMLLYGNFARKMMIEMGFDPKRLYVVHNSLDYDAQSQLRESVPPETSDAIRSRFFSQPKLPLLVFVGRLTLAKKLHMILGAMEMLTQNGKLVNTLFIGDGPAREDLEQMVRQKGLEQRVAFYGACYEENELAPMIMASDVCVSPGFVGLTAMHSLAYGTPVITHDCPDNQSPEFEAVVEGKSGAFFRENDTEDMARVIQAWLGQGKSRDEIRHSCYEIIEKYYNPYAQADIINAAVAGIRSAEELPLGESQYVVIGE